jgi:hypothetical protein
MDVQYSALEFFDEAIPPSAAAKVPSAEAPGHDLL